MSSLRTSSALFLYVFWSSDLFWTLVFLPGFPPAVRSAIKSWNNKVGIEDPYQPRHWKMRQRLPLWNLHSGRRWGGVGTGQQATTKHRACLHTKSLQPWLTLCNPMDCSPPGSSAHGIFQARILEWVAMPSSRDLPNPEIKPTSLMSPALAGRFFTSSATWEAPAGTAPEGRKPDSNPPSWEGPWRTQANQTSNLGSLLQHHHLVDLPERFSSGDNNKSQLPQGRNSRFYLEEKGHSLAGASKLPSLTSLASQ